MSPKFVAIPSFSEIISQVGEAIWVIGPTGHWVYINPTLGRFIGIPPDDVYSHPLFDYIHPDDRQSCSDCFDEIKRGSDVLEVKYRLIHRDGMEVWVSTVINGVRDASRQIQYYVGSTRKVGADRLDLLKADGAAGGAQAALPGAPDIPFAAVVEQMSEPVWVVDIARNWVYANPAFILEIGFAKEDLAGKTIDLFLVQQQHEILDGSFRRLIEGEERVDLVLEFVDSKGKPAPGRYILSPVRSPEGAITFFVGSGRKEGDVTPGSALPDPTGPFRETLDKLGAPAWIMDSKGNWIMVNSAFFLALGMKTGDMPTGTLQSMVHPDDQGIVRNAMRDLGATDVVKLSCRIQPTAGRIYWMDIVFSAIRIANEGLTYIVATAHDLTNERQLEIETAHLKDRLQDIIDQLAEAVIATDLSGKVRVINRHVTDLLDLLEVEIVEQDIADLLLPENSVTIKSALAGAMQGATGEIELVLSDGAGGTAKRTAKYGPIHYESSVDGILFQIALV